jgi:TolA-binding protein|nr:MAG TPA: hypothetical protein [Caudoviricetes sp.]
MSTKKISNPAPGTEAVEAVALNQVGTAADNDAPIEVKGDDVADTMDTPVETKAPAPVETQAPVEDKTQTPVETQAPVEDKTDDVQVTINALKASVEALTSQLQETKERLEAKERAEQRAIRLEKAGIPKALGSFIRDDADLEALNETLAGLSRTTPAGVGAVSTPTLPTVGSKNPGGEVLSIDEMIARAEANNDRAALSSLKLAKLSAASNMF